MKKLFSMLFSGTAYTLFLGVFLYLIAFLADLPQIPRRVDAGGQEAPVVIAFLVDVGLIALFGLQHSIMARPWFKKAWKRLVPAQSERSVYVLLASGALALLFVLWRPIEGDVWHAHSALLQTILWLLFAAGWLIVLASTFLINHFELFGLQQAWLYVRGRAAAAPRFRTPLLYRIVRHPLYLGFLIAFWATPVMTAGHLLFALGMSSYIFIALIYEERDLLDQFGDEYRRYQQRVGKMLPAIGRRAV